MKVKRALLSVSDKTGLLSLAKKLLQHDIELIATGGTAKLLKKAKLPCQEVTQVTEFPEILDGRVKTLHPKIHAGLLFLRDNSNHVAQVKKLKIKSIDLVIVNLYPFQAVSLDASKSEKEIIENIDIGGVSLLRSAAKNFSNVIVISHPQDYLELLQQLEQSPTLDFRKKMAMKAFSLTSSYDALIVQNFNKETDPLSLPFFHSSTSPKIPLRYGENPHQKAAFYGNLSAFFTQLHGKELSYNNLLDVHAAQRLIQEFISPTAAILKHMNPCGVGSGKTLKEAWEKAYATDQHSPFGGILIFNRPVTSSLAKILSQIFSEVILAPQFDPKALTLLQKKKNLRLLQFNPSTQFPHLEYRSLFHGFLCQESDASSKWQPQVVTKRQPSQKEWEALQFGWKVVKHVKSNAIVYATRDRTLGIGAGQMSRVDASKIAIAKAKDAGLSLKNSIIASDAFFPFPDGVVAAAKAGVSAVIQPGGSVRDAEVIETCDRYNLTMVFTGERHFRH